MKAFVSLWDKGFMGDCQKSWQDEDLQRVGPNVPIWDIVPFWDIPALAGACFKRFPVLKGIVSQENDLRSLPPGYKLVPVKTIYLEMKNRPEKEPVAIPPGCAVEHWPKPGLDKYRELFSAVGREWGWSGRLILAEEELKAILHAKTTEIYRLRCQGETAGFAEMDRRIAGQTEITYFGLLPGFIASWLGYNGMFLVSFLISIPGMLLLFWVPRQ